jgi:hypothetical protein
VKLAAAKQNIKEIMETEGRKDGYLREDAFTMLPKGGVNRVFCSHRRVEEEGGL